MVLMEGYTHTHTHIYIGENNCYSIEGIIRLQSWSFLFIVLTARGEKPELLTKKKNSNISPNIIFVSIASLFFFFRCNR